MQAKLFKEATVWTKTDCSFCEMAKDLLAAKGYEIEIKSIESINGLEEFKEKFPGIRTVPQIIVDGKYIGGYSELANYLK
jgi:thioredoxin reductase (NADPH)